MLTRYSLTPPTAELAARFGIEVPETYSPVFNAAPSHLLPVITNESAAGLSFFYWGAPPDFAKKHALGEKIINTRIESIPEKAVLKKKLKERRCLVPADGIYLWKKAGKKALIPHRVTIAGNALFAMAALWEEYDDTEGEMYHTFSIITTPAVESLHPLDERMPLIVPAGFEKHWLASASNESIERLLTPANHTWTSYTVSPIINDPARNDARIIKAAPASDQFGNLSLFD